MRRDEHRLRGHIRACGGVLRDRVEADLDGAPFPVPKLRFDVPTTAA
ncbi:MULTISPECIES: hypothetical protein [Micrococcus]|nr:MULTISPECIES: hypothetical protein [Micrococcus]